MEPSWDKPWVPKLEASRPLPGVSFRLRVLKRQQACVPDTLTSPQRWFQMREAGVRASSHVFPSGVWAGSFLHAPALPCDSQKGLWELPLRETLHQTNSALCSPPPTPYSPKPWEDFAAQPLELPRPNPLLDPTWLGPSQVGSRSAGEAVPGWGWGEA